MPIKKASISRGFHFNIFRNYYSAESLSVEVSSVAVSTSATTGASATATASF